MSLPVAGQLALGSKPELFGTEWSAFLAHLSDTNVLTLAIDEDCFWRDPLGSKWFLILVVEASHGHCHVSTCIARKMHEVAMLHAAAVTASHCPSPRHETAVVFYVRSDDAGR